MTVPSATVTPLQAHTQGSCGCCHAWNAPPPCGRCSHSTHPLTGIGPIFKPLFHPDFYFAPAQLLSQLPHRARCVSVPRGGWHYGMLLLSSEPGCRGLSGMGWDRLGVLDTNPVSRTHSLPFCSVRHPPNQQLLDGTQAGKLSQALWLPAAPAASCFRAQHTNQMDPNSLPISHCSGMADLWWGKVRPDSVQAQHFPNPCSHPALLLPAWNFKVTQQVCWKEFVCPVSSPSK